MTTATAGKRIRQAARSMGLEVLDLRLDPELRFYEVRYAEKGEVSAWTHTIHGFSLAEAVDEFGLSMAKHV